MPCVLLVLVLTAVSATCPPRDARQPVRTCLQTTEKHDEVFGSGWSIRGDRSGADGEAIGGVCVVPPADGARWGTFCLRPAGGTPDTLVVSMDAVATREEVKRLIDIDWD